jgi:hypothetical protein
VHHSDGGRPAATDTLHRSESRSSVLSFMHLSFA